MYYNDDTRCYLKGYDIDHPGWSQTAEEAWGPIEARDFVAGCFVWTG